MSGSGSQLIHESSQLGGGLEVSPVANLPTTQTEKVASFESVYLADVASYDAGAVVSFTIPQTSTYTDLSKSYVRVRGVFEVRNATATATFVSFPTATISGTTNTSYSVAKSFPNPLFSAVDFYLNGAKISPSRGNDPVIHYLDRNLLGNDVSRKVCLNGYSQFSDNTTGLIAQDAAHDEGYTLDQEDSARMGAVNSIIGGDFSNTGLMARSNRIVSDASETDYGANIAPAEVEFLYQPHIGGWLLDGDKLIPDRVEMQLQLTVSDPRYYVIAWSGSNDALTAAKLATANGVDALTPRFRITRMELILNQITISPSVMAQNSEAMLTKPWVASTTYKICQKFVIPAGSSSIDLSNVYSGPLPKAVFALLQPQEYNGNNYRYNPLTFPELMAFVLQSNAANSQSILGSTVAQSWITVNGRQIPRRPYDSQSIYQRQRQYRAYLQACKDWGTGQEPILTFEAFCFSPLFVFLIDPDEEVGNGVWSATENCVISLNMELRQIAPLPSGADSITNGVGSLYVVSYVPGTLEIDGTRAVKSKTMSGSLLSWE